MQRPASMEQWHIGLVLDSKCDCLWVRILFWTDFFYAIESELKLLNQYTIFQCISCCMRIIYVYKNEDNSKIH